MSSSGKIITAYRIAQELFLLGIFLKQFYLFSSGGFQMGDFCFMGSFVILIAFVMRWKISLGNSIGLFIGFVGCVILINCVYMGIYGNNYPGEFRFYKSTIYYIYNLFIIISFRQFVLDREFLSKLRRVLQACILSQLLVSLVGVGRYGSMRYMGTFNDPNQCGFFIFASFLLIFIISEITKEGRPLIWFIITLYLVLRTMSMGMLLGICIFLMVYTFLKISVFDRKAAFVFIVLTTGMIVVFTFYGLGILHLPEWLINTKIYRRAISKLWRFGLGARAVRYGGFENLLTDRCWDRLIEYPFKIFYGAGEGYYNRFPSARFVNNEVHSSILGPLFYYGIIPCLLWFTWTMKQLKGLKRDLWPAYLALMIESITLVNNRQPLFWMIFVLAGSYLAKQEYQNRVCLGELIPVGGDIHAVDH